MGPPTRTSRLRNGPLCTTASAHNPLMWRMGLQLAGARYTCRSGNSAPTGSRNIRDRPPRPQQTRRNLQFRRSATPMNSDSRHDKTGPVSEACRTLRYDRPDQICTSLMSRFRRYFRKTCIHPRCSAGLRCNRPACCNYRPGHALPRRRLDYSSGRIGNEDQLSRDIGRPILRRLRSTHRHRRANRMEASSTRAESKLLPRRSAVADKCLGRRYLGRSKAPEYTLGLWRTMSFRPPCRERRPCRHRRLSRKPLFGRGKRPLGSHRISLDPRQQPLAMAASTQDRAVRSTKRVRMRPKGRQIHMPSESRRENLRGIRRKKNQARRSHQSTPPHPADCRGPGRRREAA